MFFLFVANSFWSWTGLTIDYGFSVTADSASTGDRFLVVLSKAAAPLLVEPDMPGGSTGLKLYPNPLHDRLRVVVSMRDSGPYTIRVYNAAGSAVWVRSGIAAGTKTVEISNGHFMRNMKIILVPPRSN